MLQRRGKAGRELKSFITWSGGEIKRCNEVMQSESHHPHRCIELETKDSSIKTIVHVQSESLPPCGWSRQKYGKKKKFHPQGWTVYSHSPTILTVYN